MSRNVYRSIVELFRFILEGYEHSAKQKGVGGLSSVFLLLEIMHTHYCGKRIQDGGVNGVKKIEERSRNGGENSRLNLAVDAKSDSSIVYTRGKCLLALLSTVINVKPNFKEKNFRLFKPVDHFSKRLLFNFCPISVLFLFFC